MRSAAWHSSGTDVLNGSTMIGTEVLHHDAIIRSGACIEWTIKVEEDCSSTWIGVASTAHELAPDKWLGSQEGGWAYSSKGSVFYAHTAINLPYVPPHFASGTEVTMQLDLRDRGTLSVTISGKSHILFRNMLAAFREDQEIGFLPAVTLTTPGKVRFMEFCRID